MRTLPLLVIVGVGIAPSCAVPRKQFHVEEELLPQAVEASARFNALLGCTLVTTLTAGGEPRHGDGIEEIFFSDAMHRTFSAFTWVGPNETDIILRKKPSHVAIGGRLYQMPPSNYVATLVHELGHAYGLEHSPRADDIMAAAGGDIDDPMALARFRRALEDAGVRCPGSP